MKLCLMNSYLVNKNTSHYFDSCIVDFWKTLSEKDYFQLLFICLQWDAREEIFMICCFRLKAGCLEYGHVHLYRLEVTQAMIHPCNYSIINRIFINLLYYFIDCLFLIILIFIILFFNLFVFHNCLLSNFILFLLSFTFLAYYYCFLNLEIH